MGNALFVYQNRIDEERQKVAARDAKIARMQVLYESSLKTIADRDELIKHLREALTTCKELAESTSNGHHRVALASVHRVTEKALEPTP